LKPTHAQTADTFAQIEQLTARIRTLEHTLRLRATDTGLDGYACQSGAGGGGSGHGDPVGIIVALRLDHPHRDVLGHAHRQLLSGLDQARRILEQTESAARQALPPPTRQALDDGCTSCGRIKAWSPIHRTRRCQWCMDWARNHGGDDPPIDILRTHHQGRRITTRLVDTLTRRRR
jgi:hypothetical protein